ncbi:competence type IV pilus assembly protein ComGB [Sporosarcina cyprini]|uniref:competence type IV pilus assembly protein ComGB n=1 Tax=Sporosarcina cyprini TaxID=2910523 RepID=UPI001EDE85EC|nr:competence type IV pilus assembly protein ComGB [Sporosarcina cyprini]MCG3089061.1 type II secretion system F family protein [Sporosarcina cyprini]
MKWRFRTNETALVNQSAFLRRLAELLDQGYTIHDSIVILLPHYVRDYEPILNLAENAFRSGMTVTQVLEAIGFKRTVLLPIAVAEVDGTLIISLRELAGRLELKEKRDKRLKRILIYPAFLFIFMAFLLLLFRQFFLPNFQVLAQTRQAETSFSTLLPVIVGKIPDVLLLSFIAAAVGLFIVKKWYAKLTPAEKIRKLVRIPVIGSFLLKTKTSELTGEIGSLLRSGLPIQEALAMLENQRLDVLIAEMASNLKQHLIQGIPFEQAILLTDGLESNLASFAKHGSDTGHLAEELILYSAHSFETMESDISKWLAVIQPLLFTLLAICILLAYLAILLPVYGMIETM